MTTKVNCLKIIKQKNTDGNASHTYLCVGKINDVDVLQIYTHFITQKEYNWAELLYKRFGANIYRTGISLQAGTFQEIIDTIVEVQECDRTSKITKL